MGDYIQATFRLTAPAALAAVQAAVQCGLEQGLQINAAVVDPGGHLLAFWRADAAFLPSIHIAQDKAYTAVGFGMSSRQLSEAIAGEADVFAGIAKQNRVAAFPGGLPIVAQGAIVGGIGVSGASAQQDEMCARAGLAALKLTSQ